MTSESDIWYNIKMEITLVLHNIRSTYNVGAILRTAECLGVKEVVYSGYTPRHNDQRLLPHLRTKLDRQIAKSALGAEELVQQTNVENLDGWLKRARETDMKIMGLENNLSAVEEQRKVILGQQRIEAARIVLILGEEVGGIPESIRKQCDVFLEIPMQGKKESFNVSVATGIALWGLQNS